MDNSQMTPNRFGRWAKARKLIKQIQDTLNADGAVIISTATKATQYDRRHVAWFKATRNGAFVQHGKCWDCIDFCNFRFGRRA